MPHYQRRSIRLKDYDYAQEGAYFVTICTHQREHRFGQIAHEEIVVSNEGMIVLEEWDQTAILRPNLELDAFVIMPNHIHSIIVIMDAIKPNHDTQNTASVGAHQETNDANVGAWHNQNTISVGAQRAAPLHLPPSGVTPNNVKSGSLGAIVRAFKSAVTRRIHQEHHHNDTIWQRNYWERVLRNEAELNALRQYIALNPTNWTNDSLYTEQALG